MAVLMIKTLNEFQEHCEEFIDINRDAINDFLHLKDQFLKLENIAIYAFYDLFRKYYQKIKSCQCCYLDNIARSFESEYSKLLADLYVILSDLKHEHINYNLMRKIQNRIQYWPYKFLAKYHNCFLAIGDLYVVSKFKWLLNRHPKIGDYINYICDLVQDKIINNLKDEGEK